MKRWMLSGFVLIAFGMGFFKALQHPPAAGFALHSYPAAENNAAKFQSHFASSALHIQTHAASLVELKDGRIRAFWFEGSREGAKDVEIRSAVFDPAQGLWSAEQTVATRERTEQALQRYVSKLGNPVAGRAADGTLWLYYVTVSLGGWAGSSITALTSIDEGATWSSPRRLITSPFLNISTLVKGTPFLYGDGTLGLPVYHEFIGKFGELLRFDQRGAIVDKQRLSSSKDHGLQPVLLAKNADEALVLMRHAGDEHRNVVSVSTRDGGRHWSEPVRSTLANPDAALTAVALSDERMLAVLNNQKQGRDALSLMVSVDGGANWKTVYQLEDQRGQKLEELNYLKIAEGLARDSDAKVATAPGDYVASAQQQVCPEHNCRFEFSYPYLIQARRGDFHLVYTWNRSFIKHVTFTQAWLDQRLKEAR